MIVTDFSKCSGRLRPGLGTGMLLSHQVCKSEPCKLANDASLVDGGVPDVEHECMQMHGGLHRSCVHDVKVPGCFSSHFKPNSD